MIRPQTLCLNSIIEHKSIAEMAQYPPHILDLLEHCKKILLNNNIVKIYVYVPDNINYSLNLYAFDENILLFREKDCCNSVYMLSTPSVLKGNTNMVIIGDSFIKYGVIVKTTLLFSNDLYCSTCKIYTIYDINYNPISPKKLFKKFSISGIIVDGILTPNIIGN
jgi:hypothetical protein